MRVPALAKLLLQSDSRPVVEDVAAQFLLAAQEERVKCCMRPSGDALAVAVGQRLVTVRWRDPACAPDLADLGFVTAVEESEEVTAVAWPSPGVQLADECILLGTSQGWVQLHAPDGRLLHRQELHGTAVLALHVRRSGMGIDPEDRSEDVTVTFADAVVRLHSWDLQAVARWHGSKQAGGWWGGAAPPQLTLAKWQLPRGVGPRSHAFCLGCPPPELYTLLTGRRHATKLQILSVGTNPPLASFEAEEGTGPGLLSLVSDLASVTAAGLLGRAKAAAGVGSQPSTAAYTADKQQGKRAKIPAEPMALSASVWDEKRGVTSLSVSPCGAWAACCDSLGRILLVDAAATLVVMLLKGYREAQVAWLLLPAAAAQQQQQQTQQQQQQQQQSGGSGAAAQQRERYLVIYAPRRGVLELWQPRSGARAGAIKYDSKYGVLLQQPALAAAADSLGSTGGGGGGALLNHCWMLDAERSELVDLTPQLTSLVRKK